MAACIELNSRKEKVMPRLAIIMITLMVGLSACHAGFGIGDNGQHPTYVATNTFGSAVAQSSMGAQLPTGN
jgi:hypothetical protein